MFYLTKNNWFAIRKDKTKSKNLVPKIKRMVEYKRIHNFLLDFLIIGNFYYDRRKERESLPDSILSPI